MHHSTWTAQAASNYLFTSSPSGASANPADGLDSHSAAATRLLTLAAFLHDVGKGGEASARIRRSTALRGSNPSHVSRGFQVLSSAAAALRPHDPTAVTVVGEEQPASADTEFLLPPAAAQAVRRAGCPECVARSTTHRGQYRFVFEAFYAALNRHFLSLDHASAAAASTPSSSFNEWMAQLHAVPAPASPFPPQPLISAEGAKLLALLSGLHYELGHVSQAYDTRDARALHAALDRFFARVEHKVDQVLCCCLLACVGSRWVALCYVLRC